MRWLLLLLAVLALGCLAAEIKKGPDAPPAARPPPGQDVQPQQPPQNEPEQPSSGQQKVEGVSVRGLLPANVMDYTNFTFHCSAGSCTGLYRSRLVGNNNSVQADFYDESNKYKIGPMGCDSANARLSEVQKNRTIVWCNGTNTKEKFVSRLWWSEPGMGYVSIVSEERTRSFSDSTRLKNSDFAANSTAQYIIGRLDYFASAGKKIVIAEV